MSYDLEEHLDHIGHPTASDLIKFISGEMIDEDIDLVEEHLHQCESCRKNLRWFIYTEKTVSILKRPFKFNVWWYLAGMLLGQIIARIVIHYAK